MKLTEYQSHFISLLMEEKKQVINDAKQFKKSKNGLLDLQVIKLDTSGSRIKIKLKLNRDSDIYSLKIGESYLVFNSKEGDLSGQLIAMDGNVITLQIDRMQNYLYSKKLSLIPSLNHTSFDRMLKTVKGLNSVNLSAVKIRDILIGNDHSVNWNDIKSVDYFNNDLNSSQKEAVLQALNESSFFLIQGPPGTGKTTVCKELIEQFQKQNKTILVCADSNLAVDNILKQFDSGNFLRLGSSYKFDESILKFSFEYKQQADTRYGLIQSNLKKVKEYRDAKQKFIMPTKEVVGSLNNLQLCKLAESGRNFKGIKNKDLVSMKNWIVNNNRMKRHLMNIDKLKKEILSDLLKTHKVVFSTNVNSFDINNIMFDICIIDEASQTTQPSVLIPALKAKKLIMIGDHKQLPPTTHINDTDLSVSFFEKLVADNRFITLDTQYRMHNDICEFISNEFYDNQLQTAVDYQIDKSYAFDTHLVYLNHDGKEKSVGGSKSKINETEAEIVIDLLKQYESSGFNLGDIGVISPYLDQCYLIRRQLAKTELKNSDEVKVSTVDSFQGHQKKVIILSLVRNNEANNLGFLKDLRRLNVSVSRAMNQLVIVGNKKTITSNEVYDRLIKYVGSKGTSKQIKKQHK